MICEMRFAARASLTLSILQIEAAWHMHMESVRSTLRQDLRLVLDKVLCGVKYVIKRQLNYLHNRTIPSSRESRGIPNVTRKPGHLFKIYQNRPIIKTIILVASCCILTYFLNLSRSTFSYYPVLLGMVCLYRNVNNQGLTHSNLILRFLNFLRLHVKLGHQLY